MGDQSLLQHYGSIINGNQKSFSTQNQIWPLVDLALSSRAWRQNSNNKQLNSSETLFSSSIDIIGQSSELENSGPAFSF